MNEKIRKAVQRLSKTLPLKERQEQCEPAIKVLHQYTLSAFVTKGRILSKSEMRAYVDDLADAIQVLSQNELVIFTDGGDPVGAYPFTMEERESKVVVNEFKLNAMCAIDALAVSLMYDVHTEIYSSCRITDQPIYIRQSGMEILNPSAAGGHYVCIAWNAVESDIKCADSLCMEMFFAIDQETAVSWHNLDPQNREIFTMAEALEFSRQFFVPLTV